MNFKKITESEKLIIIFPVWWQSVAAILKGFFDKVLTPKFAFEYKGEKATVICTTGNPRF